MFGEVPAKRLRLIERTVHAARRLIRRTHAPATLAIDFLRAYYRGVAAEDLAARGPGDLAAAALAHLRLGTVRPRGRPLVRVLSPSAAQDGFASEHSLVLVVTDDMPFLVDSIGIVFSQASIGVHLIVHPVLSVERDADGRIASAGLAGRDGGRWESWQLLEIDRQLDPARIADLERRLLATLSDVRAA